MILSNLILQFYWHMLLIVLVFGYIINFCIAIMLLWVYVVDEDDRDIEGWLMMAFFIFIPYSIVIIHIIEYFEWYIELEK